MQKLLVVCGLNIVVTARIEMLIPAALSGSIVVTEETFQSSGESFIGFVSCKNETILRNDMECFNLSTWPGAFFGAVVVIVIGAVIWKFFDSLTR